MTTIIFVLIQIMILKMETMMNVLKNIWVKIIMEFTKFKIWLKNLNMILTGMRDYYQWMNWFGLMV